MNELNTFVQPLQIGTFHAMWTARLSPGQVEDAESGDTRLLQGDSKFNADGSQNFGYDCILEW